MEAVKFSQEDMDKIKKIQNQYFAFSTELGQIEIEKNALENRLNAINEVKQEAWKKYEELRKEEQEMIQEFNTKYGDGVLDLESGTFQPKSEESPNN
jgi:chromosome segregation ATPase